MSTAAELEPYLVMRRVGAKVECAIWKLASGEAAVALFSTEGRALAYPEAAQLSADWQVRQPDRATLVQIFHALSAEGIGFAVLDPDREQAQRLFDLQAVLRAAQSASTESGL